MHNQQNSNFILHSLLLALFVVLVVTLSLLSLKQEKAELAKRLAMEEAQERVYLTGRFDPAQMEGFVAVEPQYVQLYAQAGGQMYLRKETYNAFIQMQNAAKKDGVNLKLASATRNFDHQRKFWEDQWSADIIDKQNGNFALLTGVEKFKKILEYSAAPGTSRHHWGTDIDINGANVAYFNTLQGKQEHEWLVQNAYKFGFCQAYNTKISGRTAGHNEEKWHWTYLPLSRTFTERYKNLMTNENISGFLGDEYVPFLDLVNDYVLSINPQCL